MRPKRNAVLKDEEVAQWLATFGQVDEQNLKVQDKPHEPTAAAAKDTEVEHASGIHENPFPSEHGKKLNDQDKDDLFPPGYGEDLLKGGEDDL